MNFKYARIYAEKIRNLLYTNSYPEIIEDSIANTTKMSANECDKF